MICIIFECYKRAIFRQGWKTLWTNPVIWARNAAKTWPDMVKRVGGRKVLDEVSADIVSRENYDLYRKAGLAVATVEEAFPTTIPEKVPLFGRLYAASQDTYTGFLYRQRADIFDKYIEVARKTDVDLTADQLPNGAVPHCVPEANLTDVQVASGMPPGSAGWRRPVCAAGSPCIRGCP
jgi:hypothetical protein